MFRHSAQIRRQAVDSSVDQSTQCETPVAVTLRSSPAVPASPPAMSCQTLSAVCRWSA